MERRILVITSINSTCSPGIKKLRYFLEKNSLRAIIIGDKKTPSWESDDVFEFISLDEQNEKWKVLSRKIPVNHYARKNLGYLRAMELGIESILDTDDDNVPFLNPWEYSLNKSRLAHNFGWFNIYRAFGQKHIWPRGLPLNFANSEINDFELSTGKRQVDCFQSLVDGDPDIDAIGRLLFPDKVEFAHLDPVVLSGDSRVPTNSQATLWSRWVFPLLYLPSTASFRMTDIWRGFIAQAALAHFNGVTAFGKLGFSQERNDHNLIKDFESEVSGHLFGAEVYQVALEIWKDIPNNRTTENLLSGLLQIYLKLVALNILESEEIEILNSWVDNFKSMQIELGCEGLEPPTP